MRRQNDEELGRSVAQATLPAPGANGDRRLALLVGPSPGAILEAITPGDPLELEALCLDTTLTRAVLLDPFRVYLRTLARTAHDAFTDPRVGRPHLHGWLIVRIDRVLDELIAEQSTTRRLVEESDPYTEHVSTILGLPLARARSACVAFNRLDERVRQAFFSVVVDGRSPEQCAAEDLGTLSQIRADVAFARRTLGLT